MENNIKYWREYYGISQRQLANKINISNTAISEIEFGKHIPSILNAMNIAKALKMPVDKVFVEDGCKLSLT